MAAVDRAGRKSSGGSAGPLHRRDSRKVAEQYAGAGKTFKVKCIGSDEVSDSRGDAVAADCLKRLRSVCEDPVVGPQKLTKATISLQFKGVTVFDEKSRSITLQVPVEKVTYVCHDPEEACVFAVIVRTEEGTNSRLKLYGFKADLKTAVAFVHSARELFQLMYKLMKAKRRLSGQLEEAESSEPKGEEAIQLTSVSEEGYTTAKSVVPQASSTGAQNGSTVPSSPPATKITHKEHDSAVMEEWNVLEKELKQIAKDLGMEEEGVPTQPEPREETSMQLNSSTASDPFSDDFFQKSFESPSKFNAAGGTRTSPFSHDNLPSGQPPSSAANLFASTPGGQALTSSPIKQRQTSKDEISLILNPFDSNSAPFHSSPNTGPDIFTGTDTSFELSNPLYRSPGSGSMLSNSQQSPRQQMPFYSPTQQLLGFSPSTGMVHSHSTSSNPFATDFESPPFGVSPRAHVPFQNAVQSSFGNQSTAGNVSVASDASDPFAHLIPFTSVPDKPPLAARQPETQQVKQQVPKTKLSWDTFEEHSEGPSAIPTQEPQRPMSREKPAPRTDSFHAQFEDSFQDMPEQQKKASLGGFEDSFHEVPQNKAIPGIFEDSFQEHPSERRLPSGFEDDFQSQRTGHEPQKAVFPFPSLPASQGLETRRVKTAEHPLESGFEDHFVSFSEGPSHSANSFGETFTNDKADPSKPSWISFTS